MDAGLTLSETIRRLNTIGVMPESLRAVVVTHEHYDHMRSVGAVSRRLGIPVYITSETERAGAHVLGRLKKIIRIQSGYSFGIDGLSIQPFSIPHDAADPIGLSIRNETVKVGISTDLGMITHLVCHELKDCRALVMEANHDADMLEFGPYPWELKQRIKGRLGHLSNSQTCEMLREIVHPRLQHVVLAHLSKTNNHPEKAYWAVKCCLSRFSISAGISLAWQGRVGKLVEVY
ncbi:MAG: MBL fold metallo-hydrolase [Pseudomonadota bacterium]